MITRKQLIDLIVEASIDAVTPEVLRGARKITSRLFARKAAAFDPEALLRGMETNGPIFTRAVLAGRTIPTARGSLLGRVKLKGRSIPVHTRSLMPFSGAYSRTTAGPGEVGFKEKLLVDPATREIGGSRRTIFGLAAHELVHAADPGMTHHMKRLVRQTVTGVADANLQRAYASSPAETHAYSAIAGTLGIRSLKQLGAKGSTVRAIITRPYPPGLMELTKLAGQMDNPKAVKQISSFMKKVEKQPYTKLINQAMASKKPGIQRAFDSTSTTLATPLGKIVTAMEPRARRKFFKEVYKGAERQYGKSLRMKRKLPESREELVDRIIEELQRSLQTVDKTR